MNIKSLALQQFRNISKTYLKFEKNLIVFVGDNGQGKTNIIESLVFLSTGRSFRVSDDKQLIQSEQQFARIDAVVDNGDYVHVAISSQGKYLNVNKRVIKRLSDFVGTCNVVLFNPEDLNFISDSKKRRRNDVDLELGKLSKNYLNLLNQYQMILSERNALLKNQTIDFDYLDILTHKLVTTMIPIYQQRNSFCKRIQGDIASIFSVLSESTNQVELRYQGPVNDDLMTSDYLMEKFRTGLDRDLMLKATQIGIHRDDYIFTLDGEQLINRASQGQKRLIMLAYKLALVNLVKEKKGYYPILCLDDLFSELDATRRKSVLEILPESLQVFITTTDLEFIKTHKPVQIFRVEQGMITSN